jgi:hypothetical protein
MVFLNHFQFPIRYDVGLKLLSTLHQDTTAHISDHIQEWHRWKRLIKTPIPLNFILEWFLKSFHPPISKDVATYGVTTEEEAIFRARQLDFIYAQSGMLYHLLPEALRSTYDPRKNPISHADGIVGSANVKSTDMVKNQLKELSLSQSVGGTTSFVSSNPTHSEDVHSVQSLKNPYGNQQQGGNNKKGRNKRKGGKNGNKPKDNNNNEKTGSNFGEGKREKCKVNFPCNICTYDHLTHLFPKLAEAARLLAQSPAVMMMLDY